MKKLIVLIILCLSIPCYGRTIMDGGAGLGYISGKFLKLSAANDPVTGTLTISADTAGIDFFNIISVDTSNVFLVDKNKDFNFYAGDLTTTGTADLGVTTVDGLHIDGVSTIDPADDEDIQLGPGNMAGALGCTSRMYSVAIAAFVIGDISTFTGQANDKIKVIVDGVTTDDIDISAATDLDDVVDAINAATGGSEASKSGVPNYLRILSNTTGTNSSVTIADGTNTGQTVIAELFADPNDRFSDQSFETRWQFESADDGKSINPELILTTRSIDDLGHIIPVLSANIGEGGAIFDRVFAIDSGLYVMPGKQHALGANLYLTKKGFKLAGTINDTMIIQYASTTDEGVIQTQGDTDPPICFFPQAGVTNFGSNEANTDLTVNFQGTSNSGQMLWDEDLDYFKYMDDIFLNSAEKLKFRDNTIAIYSQADTFLDLYADGLIRMGNSSAGAPTTYVSIEPDGGIVSVGEGSGLVFGEISVKDNAVATTLNSGAIVQLTVFDTDGLSNNMTPDHTNDHITVTKAGKYLATISIHINNNAAQTHIVDVSMYKNNGGTEFANVHGHRTLTGGSGDVGPMSLSGIVDLAVNDTIEMWATTDVAADRSVTFEDITMGLVQLGGT